MYRKQTRPLNLELKDAGTAAYRRQTYGPRRLEGYQFWWAVEGHARLRLGDTWIALSPGIVVLRQPQVEEYLDASDSDYFLHGFAMFDADLPAPGWPDPAAWPTHLRAQSDSDLLAVLPRHILDIKAFSKPLSRFLIGPVIELLLRSFITQTTADHPPQHSFPSKILDAVRIVHEALDAHDTPTATLGLAELAQRLNISVSRLSGLFHDHLHLGPMACMRNLRLMFASQQLVQPDPEIKEIAHAAGFESQHHFARCFKALFGLSPTEYRRKLLQQWDYSYPEIVLALQHAISQAWHHRTAHPELVSKARKTDRIRPASAGGMNSAS